MIQLHRKNSLVSEIWRTIIKKHTGEYTIYLVLTIL